MAPISILHVVDFAKIERGAGLLRRQMHMLVLVVVLGAHVLTPAILGAIP